MCLGVCAFLCLCCCVCVFAFLFLCFCVVVLLCFSACVCALVFSVFVFFFGVVVYLCFCVFVFLCGCVFVFVFLRGCVFVWLCFCVFSACVCFFVFVVKTPPLCTGSRGGGKRSFESPRATFYMYLSHGGGEKCGPNLGSLGPPTARYRYTTATCFASISRWGLAFFWLLYRACGRVGGHSNLFFYKFQGVFCNQAAGHDMTLMTLNTFHLMINATEYGTLPPKSSRTLCCFCKFTANSMAKFTANSMSTTRLALETCRNNALKTVTIIHNDNGRTLKESKCPVKP